tara:strand:- start:5011 stop:5148 length:138 start_codon:yes stop_codon:yes gene_type:complete
MKSKNLQWVNSVVLMEALQRYEQNLLPLSMKRWVEAIFELNSKND